MADLAQLESALVKADAAGDAEAAKAFAGEIRRLREFAALKAEGPASRPPEKPYQIGNQPEISYSDPELLAAHPSMRVLKGLASPFVGAVQKASAVMGGPLAETVSDYEKMTRRGRERLGSEGFDWFEGAGTALSPAYLAAAKALPVTSSAGGRIAQGAGFGATAGVLAPVEGEDILGQSALQAGLGAVGGALLPAGWEGAKAVGRGVRNVAQPYMGQWGADQSAGRLANLAAGDKADEVINAMLHAREIVPGSRPTAGQAASGTNSAEFAALQKVASDKAPSVYAGPKGIEGGQNAARLAAIRSVGRTPQELEAAILERKAVADTLYKQAREEGVAPELAQMQQNQIKNLLQRMPPGLREKAKELARIEGINVPKFGSVEGMHYLKKAIDDIFSKQGESGLGDVSKRILSQYRQDLLSTIDELSPSYKAARETYAKMSPAINRMEIGQELEKKLIPALSEEAKQRAGVFANAVREAPQTIKRATGEPRYQSLEDALTPQQMASVSGVQQDLARDAVTHELAKRGMKSAQERIGKAVPEVPPTGMFSPILSVTRGAYNRLSGKATDKIIEDLALRMKDPVQMAKIMQNAKPFERQALLDILNRYQASQVDQASKGGQ